MAELEDVRHELFCRYRSSGMSQAEAYRRAGYQGNAAAASILANKPHIVERLREMAQEKLAREGLTPDADETFEAAKAQAESGVLTKEWVLQELIENARLARQAQQYAASNNALKMVGEVLGAFGGREAQTDDKLDNKKKALPIEQVNKLLDAIGFQGQIDAKTMQPVKVEPKKLRGPGRPRKDEA